ncbi:tyrosine-type recombinase/integrase, partial [Neisseria sp. P0008.S010]
MFHNYFELAFFSGMRTSELIALTWQDIDFQRQCVRVNKASV